MPEYFSIVKFHNGHFDLAGTLNGRTDFTDQCQNGDSATKKVNDKYGTSQSGRDSTGFMKDFMPCLCTVRGKAV